MLMLTIKHAQLIIPLTIITLIFSVVFVVLSVDHQKIEQDRYLNKLRKNNIDVYLSKRK